MTDSSPAPATTATATRRERSGPQHRHLIDERRRLIGDLVRDAGRVTVEELVARFAVSPVTIRGDLSALEAAGVLVRSHGGALSRRDDHDLPIGVKETQHHAEKVRIAQAAVAMLSDGETIILDSGTTTAEIAKALRTATLTSLNVITNALNVAALLLDLPHVRLIVPGGVLRPESRSLAGHLAEAALATLRADRLFLGVDGFDPEIGLMTPHLAEAQLNARMIEISRQVVAVADSSKFARRNVSVIATTDQLDVLITDTAADPGVVEELRRRGVEVVTV